MANIDSIHKEVVQMSDDDKALLALLTDPVAWSEAILRDPDNPNKPIRLRWYQKEALRHQPEEVVDETGKLILINRIKQYRMGRRIGKSIMLSVEAVYKAATNHNFQVLYIAPFESQCIVFFNMIEKLIANTAIIPKRFVRKPFRVEFENGSTISAHTANVRSSRKGSSIRGAEADLLLIDEMDHGIDEVVTEVIMPIFMGNKTSAMVSASTPSGRRGLFYTWSSEGSKMGIKEFHYPSTISPNWDEKAAALYRRTLTREQYVHEVESEFGTYMEGVYRHKDLDIAMSKYNYADCKYDPKCQYIMGVDWNENFGVCIVIVEMNRIGKYRIVLSKIVEKQEFTQMQGVNEIIRLHREEWPCNYIYVDRGYGNTQIELLKSYGMQNKSSNLVNIVKEIDYGSTLEIRDPISNQKVSKPAKSFMVNNSCLVLESHNISIPEEEDQEYGIIGQMRNFRISRISNTGVPVYEGDNNDHSLNAVLLALTGFMLEYENHDTYKPIDTIALIKRFNVPRDIRRETVDPSMIIFKQMIKDVNGNSVEKTPGKPLIAQVNTVSKVEPRRRMSGFRRSSF